MDNDGPISRAPLPLLDLADEVDESGAGGRHGVLRPVCVLELLHVERGAVVGVHQLELPQSIVGEVGGFAGDDLQFVVLLRPRLRPVAVTFVLQQKHSVSHSHR